MRAIPIIRIVAPKASIGTITPCSAPPNSPNTATRPATTMPNVIMFCDASSPAFAIGAIASAMAATAAPNAIIPPMLVCSLGPTPPRTAARPATTMPKAPIAAAPSRPVLARGAMASAMPETPAEKAIMPFIPLFSFLPTLDKTTAILLTAAANPSSGATAFPPCDAIPSRDFANKASEAIIAATPVILAREPRALFKDLVCFVAFLLLFPNLSKTFVAPVAGSSQDFIFLYALNAPAPAIMSGIRLASPSAFLFAHLKTPFSAGHTASAAPFRTLNAGVNPSIIPRRFIFFMAPSVFLNALVIASPTLLTISAMVGKSFLTSISSMAPMQLAIPRVMAVPMLVNAVLIPPVAVSACFSKLANPSTPSLFSRTMVSINSSIDMVPVRKPSPSSSAVMPMAFATWFNCAGIAVCMERHSSISILPLL